MKNIILKLINLSCSYKSKLLPESDKFQASTLNILIFTKADAVNLNSQQDFKMITIHET